MCSQEVDNNLAQKLLTRYPHPLWITLWITFCSPGGIDVIIMIIIISSLIIMRYELTIATVTKTGTSLAVVIPKKILKAYGIQRGDPLIFICLDADKFYLRRPTEEELGQLKLPTIN